MRVIKKNLEEVFPKFDIKKLDNLIAKYLSNEDGYEIKKGSLEKHLNWKGEEYNICVNCKFRKLRHANRRIIEPIYKELMTELYEATEKRIQIRTFLHYRPDDFMGWHTNANAEGERYYLTWAEEDNKSSFNYIDNGKIVEVFDKKGWQVNCFNIEKDNILHHSIMSSTNRFSIGMRCGNGYSSTI